MVEGLARVISLLPASEASAAGLEVAQPIVDLISTLSPQAAGEWPDLFKSTPLALLVLWPVDIVKGRCDHQCT